MSRTLVFGATGQVGRAVLSQLKAQLGPRSDQGLDRALADFATPQSLRPLLDRLHRDQPVGAIVNAAAYTAVDQAESEEALARTLNAESPAALARWCADHGVPLIHYSTDYVFDGSGERPWREDDPTRPLSAYGRTKLEGEQAIQASGADHLIFRTSWVYDEQGKNFLRTMLKLGKDREELRVVADQHGAPTYAPHLARATLAALESARQLPVFPSGIYHLCNTGETTWHGFAEAIFECAHKRELDLRVRKVEPILTSAYPTPAKRPGNSRLGLSKIRLSLGIEMPEWHRGLEECMENLTS